jgi:hypothetical protein
MARRRQQERPPETVSPTGPRPRFGKPSVAVFGLSMLLIVWAAIQLTPAGQVAYSYIYYFFEFYAGVFVLLLLTATVVGGLICTDRIMLGKKQRVLMQTIHRVTGTGAIFFLFIHIATKITVGKAALIDAFVPFLNFKALYVGLGTLASYAMFLVFWSGIARARFVGKPRPWLWRGVHSAAYLSWPMSIMHGLTAGRSPATWVTVSYIVALVVVVVGLFFRLTLGGPRAKPSGATGTMTGSMKPVGKVAADTDIFAAPKPWTGARDKPAAEIARGRIDVLESERPERPRRGRVEEEEYVPRRAAVTDAPYDAGYIDLSEPPTPRYSTERIPVRDERKRRDEEVAARIEAEERAREEAELRAYEAEERAREAEERAREAEERAAERDRETWREERPAWGVSARPTSGIPRPTSGPPRHRLIEEDEDYAPPPTRRSRRDEPDDYDAYEPFDALAADDTPTLVDMASRRALRAVRDSAAATAAASATTASRRGRRRRSPEDAIDDRYWVS